MYYVVHTGCPRKLGLHKINCKKKHPCSDYDPYSDRHFDIFFSFRVLSEMLAEDIHKPLKISVGQQVKNSKTVGGVNGTSMERKEMLETE